MAQVTAKMACDLLDIQHNSSTLSYHKIRLVIGCHLTQEASRLFGDKIELDESYFGGIRKSKRGRGASGKTAVFGLLKWNSKVYAIVVKDTKTNTLIPIITSKIKLDSIVYTGSYKSYNAIDVSNFKHFRINHSKEFAKDHNHINGIESF